MPIDIGVWLRFDSVDPEEEPFHHPGICHEPVLRTIIIEQSPSDYLVPSLLDIDRALCGVEAGRSLVDLFRLVAKTIRNDESIRRHIYPFPDVVLKLSHEEISGCYR